MYHSPLGDIAVIGGLVVSDITGVGDTSQSTDWVRFTDMVYLLAIVRREAGLAEVSVTIEGATDASGTGAAALSGLDDDVGATVGHLLVSVPTVKLAVLGFSYVRVKVAWVGEIGATMTTSICLLGFSAKNPASGYDAAAMHVSRVIL